MTHLKLAVPTNRLYRRDARLGVFVTIAMTAACADSPTAPTDELSFRRKISPEKPMVEHFVVNPNAGITKTLGDHKIKFPAASICDPATSTYGLGEWDAPCEPLKTPITITASWWTDPVSGQPVIAFTPELRFVPTLDSQKWVTLHMRDKRASHYMMTHDIQILWYYSGQWIDESLTDPTLETQPDGRSGRVYRRIKHFSGYMVTAGRALKEVAEDSESVDYDG